MHFTKMQGIGNDYIYLDCMAGEPDAPSLLARRMSDRHFGIGSDGLVLICPGVDGADFTMRMFNSDGSESEMCGNACRCIGKYVYERGLTKKQQVRLMTGAGLKLLDLTIADGIVTSVRVDMGVPQLNPAQIPVALLGQQVMDVPLTIGQREFRLHCVGMGNPHCVLFVDDPEEQDLPYWGAAIEHHPLFPNRTNVQFVGVKDRTHITMRTWERGAGETLACGTGACAVMTASVITNRVERCCDITLRGGVLRVTWADNGHLYQEGPAAFVFDGEWPE